MVPDRIEPSLTAGGGGSLRFKREPAPPGPVAVLLDHLHELHLHAGEPGVRQIASGIGRGVLSYTTVHNIFRGPRVPKWGHLELVVEQLGGDVEAFRELWKSARLAELGAPVDNGGPDGTKVESAGGQARESPEAHHAEQSDFGFVVVAQRLPADELIDGTRAEPWQSTGGIGFALCELIKDRGGVWVGWSGNASSFFQRSVGNGIAVRSISMSADEVTGHYGGYCSSTIWPLYHCATEDPDFDSALRDTSRLVNQRFADAAARSAAPGGLVWVHDYHLQLVPGMLRDQRPDLRIGFFLHTPFPPMNVFRRLPGREEILRGVLGADLVGFQDELSLENFLASVRRLLGLKTSGPRIDVEGRAVTAGVYPVSIDTPAVEALVQRDEVRERASRIRRDLGAPATLFVGIDRLDYTKGIVDRLNVYGELLREGKLPPEATVLIQLATSSRESLPGYAHLRGRIEQLVGKLNGDYGRVGRPVVHYTRNASSFDEIVSFYLAADVMLATPVSDGMNLTAKEYVASRTDNTGVLVLSEFAGAAAELEGSLLVNPYDELQMKATLVRAAKMSAAEQRSRMRPMRGLLAQRDVRYWMTSFMSDLISA